MNIPEPAATDRLLPSNIMSVYVPAFMDFPSKSIRMRNIHALTECFHEHFLASLRSQILPRLILLVLPLPISTAVCFLE